MSSGEPLGRARPDRQKTWVRDLHGAIRDITPLWEELGGQGDTLSVYSALIHRRANLILHNTVAGIKDGIKHYDDRAAVDETDLDTSLRAAFMCLNGLAQLVAPEVRR